MTQQNQNTKQQISEHALALLGYKSKSYFDTLTTEETTKFNFWRGMIQAKGTNMSIDAFTTFRGIESTQIDEYWAYKIAEFGDSREKTFPEIKISVSDVSQKYSKFQFYSSADATYNALPTFTQIENNDISRWFSVEDLGKGMKFEAQKISEIITIPSSPVFPFYVKLKNIYYNHDGAAPQVLKVIANKVPMASNDIQVISASLVKVLAGTAGDEYIISGHSWINPTKLSPIKLFDYKEKVLIEEIGIWNPAIGIHPYAPLEIVNIIDSVDPAKYNYSTKILSNSNYRHLKPWAEKEVGRVWWDTSNLGYVPYYDEKFFTNRNSRNAQWGNLADWASVDLYQWTKSDVHPADYDALALAQEGSASISTAEKSSGRVAFKKNYSRNRIVSIRPIAWSESTTGAPEAHPSFGPAEFTSIYASGKSLIADKGRCEAAGLIAGKHFGGWLLNKPYGEVELQAGLTYDIGTSVQNGFSISSWTVPSDMLTVYDSLGSATQIVPTNIARSIRIEEIVRGNLGDRIGSIAVTKKIQTAGENTYIVKMADGTGFFEEVIIPDWTNPVEQTYSIKFVKFGLGITLEKVASPDIISASIIASIVEASITDLYVRECIGFSEIVPLPAIVYVNDQTDPLYSSSEYEWRSWSVPSQLQLDADLVARPTWKPYIGDLTTISVSSSVVEMMNSATSNLVLKTGVPIKRYNSIWTDWSEIIDLNAEVISNGVTLASFVLSDAIDTTRLSVYVNGIQINPGSYTIDSSNTVTLQSVLAEGTIVRMRYRGYQPTAADIAFNPDVAENFEIQVQYKQDYQYTKSDIRSDTGSIVGTRYYFWVKDKSIPDVGSSMSLQQAKLLLSKGPDTFAIFERLVDTLSPPSYDSCSISGLKSIVTKNDSYKLRFLRDFTLRDDPEEIRLKNTHSEWQLIRKSQNTAIPRKLWDLLINAVAGQDEFGSPIPSQARIDYDAKNNTRSRFGFNEGQIFADSELVKTSIVNTILNTSLSVTIGGNTYYDRIAVLNDTDSAQWFINPITARYTMELIWSNASAKQINEIFFNVLEDALADNYEFSDIFKTSYITSNTKITLNQGT